MDNFGTAINTYVTEPSAVAAGIRFMADGIEFMFDEEFVALFCL